MVTNATSGSLKSRSTELTQEIDNDVELIIEHDPELKFKVCPVFLQCFFSCF